MSVVRKLAGETAIYGLSNMARLINFLILARLQTSALEVESHGVVTQLYSYTSFFVVFLTYGMETAFFRFCQGRSVEKVLSTSFKTILFTSLIFQGLVILSGDELAKLSGFDEQGNLFRVLSIILVLDTLSAIPFAHLRQQNKPLHFALIKSINLAINILGNLYFLWWLPNHVSSWPGFNQNTMIQGIFFSNVMASSITLVLLSPSIIKAWIFPADKLLRKEMLKYALPLVWVGLAGMINETLDRVLIVYLRPDDGLYQTGIYGACYKISIFMTLFVQAYRFAAEPFFFSRMKALDGPQQYVRTMNWFVLACSVIFVGITLFLPVFRHLIDARYWEGLSIVPILLLANLFLGVHYNLSIWYKLTDKTKLGSSISILGAAITILLNFILIPIYGYHGAAVTTLICYFSMAIFSYFMGRKHFPVPYQVVLNLWMILSAVSVFLIFEVINQRWNISMPYQLILASILCLLFIYYLLRLLKFKPNVLKRHQ